MHLSRLALDHFRSWDHLVLDLGPGVTILQGPNGLGKTNIVEAVEVLATGGSHRTSSSLPLVQRGQPAATIRANVTDGDRTVTYEATIRAKGANRARINGGPSLYMRRIVGDIPVVAFTPEDQAIVAGDPSARRTFLNQAASQLIPGYAQSLQQFTHVARQRAALLRQLAQSDSFDAARDAALSGLETWTGHYITLGLELTRARQRLVDRLQEPFSRLVQRLAGEDVRLQYEPSFAEVAEDSPETAVSAHFQRLYAGEVARGQNLIGPQRDDLAVLIDDVPAREFASNGQLWTLALALRMAVHELLSAAHGEPPIVILDDVFAQLDEARRAQILDFAQGQPQVLVTVAAASDIPPLGDARVIDVAQLGGED